MDQIIFSTTGYIHFITATIAMITGTYVIVAPKGTRTHVRWGYAYTASMVVMLITSFMIYRLFNGFGIFHYFSVVSTITLIGGLIPAFRRKPEKTWVIWHFAFMYWSIIGLYAAFVSEVVTRVPETPYFGMLGIAIFVVMGIANYFWFKYKKVWTQQFAGA
jgi:hypothetical protein